MGDGLMFGLGQRIPREIAGNYGRCKARRKGLPQSCLIALIATYRHQRSPYVSESYIGRPDSRQRPKTLKSAFPSAKLGTDA